MELLNRLMAFFSPKSNRYTFEDAKGTKCRIISPRVFGEDGDRLVHFTYASKHCWIRDVFVWTEGPKEKLYMQKQHPFLNLGFEVTHLEQGIQPPIDELLTRLDSIVNTL